jgi:hypothetical protein
MRGIELPSWTSQTGMAVNRVWLEYVRRGERTERARVEHASIVAYALAGSPHADADKRFEVVEPAKQVLLSHLTGSVHRTEYKRHLLEKKLVELEDQVAEQERISWIASDAFSLADWIAGK